MIVARSSTCICYRVILRFMINVISNNGSIDRYQAVLRSFTLLALPVARGIPSLDARREGRRRRSTCDYTALRISSDLSCTLLRLFSVFFCANACPLRALGAESARKRRGEND